MNKINSLIFSVFFVLFFISCNNNKDENLNDYIQCHEKPNFYCKQVENDLMKFIEVYPKTDKISIICYINKSGKRDSTYLKYNKAGKLEYKIKYINSNRSYIKTDYYKNGNIKKEYMVHNNHLQGEAKRYYETGKLKSIEEILVYNDSIEYANNKREYKKTGELNIDSTMFAEMFLNKDTISIQDSTEITLNVIKPDSALATAYVGSIEKYHKSVINYDTVKFIGKNGYYFKPNKKGGNFVKIVVVIGIKMKNGHYKNHNIFLKKKVHVTE